MNNGEQNAQFFTGKAKKLSSEIDYKPVIKFNDKLIKPAYKTFTQGGNFTAHISKMIPGFQEKQQIIAGAIVESNAKTFLDIGTSEGGLIKTVSHCSNIHSTGIDPNPAMMYNYIQTPIVKDCEYQLKAFGASWIEQGILIEEFKPQIKFDIINEDFTFQFISNNRGEQIKRVKSILADSGIFITSEKFFTKDYERNEQDKLDHQSQYFSADELTEDKQTIISGMASDMVHELDYMEILKANFGYVIQFWDAGNFKGFACSDDQLKLVRFIMSMQNMNSQFSTIKTPCTVN